MIINNGLYDLLRYPQIVYFLLKHILYNICAF